MAKPLPNEQAVYQRIHDEKITVPLSVWEEMYCHMGDYISVINLVLSYYIDRNEPIPVVDARKILDYALRIKDTMMRILYPEENKDLLLHPLVRDLFTHYIGNDLHIINLCVSFYLDPLDEKPLALEDAKKILPCTITMRQFLDRLREVTNR
ncbi:MAG: hypothetical protein HQL21_05165 [Candidatus Omnitrophica bacterium]|nr:hypothetical protein [Candidatus Omnitrophota bacterium]